MSQVADVPPKRVTAKKKVTVDLPGPLYDEAEAIVQSRRITTSTLIREAVEQYVKSIREKELESLLEHGYRANETLSKEVHDEFASVDAEGDAGY